MPSRMMTTSRPPSTMRLARSRTSSATWVCSSDGRSNVDAATSPLISHRFMSVTSSGRSSTSSTNRATSGSLISIDLAICFMIVVLPALGGETIRPRWPFPIGEIRSMIRAVMLLGSSFSSSDRRASGNSGVRSSKRARWLRPVGRVAVDGVDLQQRRVLLLAGRRTALALEPVASAEAELADLLDRDVHVVLGRQVAVEAEEAVALVAEVEQALDHRPARPGRRRRRCGGRGPGAGGDGCRARCRHPARPDHPGRPGPGRSGSGCAGCGCRGHGCPRRVPTLVAVVLVPVVGARCRRLLRRWRSRRRSTAHHDRSRRFGRESLGVRSASPSMGVGATPAAPSSAIRRRLLGHDGGRDRGLGLRPGVRACIGLATGGAVVRVAGGREDGVDDVGLLRPARRLRAQRLGDGQQGGAVLALQD